MLYTQVIPFNQNTAGTVQLECLKNNRLGYSIPAKYPNAITAWQHTQQHTDRNFPANVTTPLFYSFEVDGHINEHLADGRIWSDGVLYPSLDDYLTKHPKVTFLGWGESINDVRVIQGEDMRVTAGVLDALKWVATRQHITQPEIDKYQDDIEGFAQYLTTVQSEHNVAPQVVGSGVNKASVLDFLTKNLK